MVTAHKGKPSFDPKTKNLTWTNTVFGMKCFKCGLFVENSEETKEKMKTIKFSNEYIKMPPYYQKARLLEVFDTTKAALSEDFITYDTTKKNGNQYELPDGRLIVLLLQSEGRVWTTVRRWTESKANYYRGSRGEIFKCIVEDTQ